MDQFQNFSAAAIRNIEETGIDPLEDVRRVREMLVSRDALLEECLQGADDDRIDGWQDYVSAICGLASLEE